MRGKGGEGKSQDATLTADAAALFRMQGVKGLEEKPEASRGHISSFLFFNIFQSPLWNR